MDEVILEGRFHNCGNETTDIDDLSRAERICPFPLAWTL